MPFREEINYSKVFGSGRVRARRCRGRGGGDGRDAARGAGREGVGRSDEGRRVGRAHEIRRLGAEGEVFRFLGVCRAAWHSLPRKRRCTRCVDVYVFFLNSVVRVLRSVELRPALSTSYCAQPCSSYISVDFDNYYIRPPRFQCGWDQVLKYRENRTLKFVSAGLNFSTAPV